MICLLDIALSLYITHSQIFAIMSNLPFHPKPIPASVPITTRGNAFWRDDERFFVKGISYHPRNKDIERGNLSTTIDPLCDEHIPELEQDMDFVLDLGMNSISIHHIDPDKNHGRAMEYLEEKGIYVMVPLFIKLGASNPRSESRSLYNLDLIIENFRLVHEMAQYPNTLAFVVRSHSINNDVNGLLRACIRDTKAFLRQVHPTHGIPVGVTAQDSISSLHRSIQYFSAGPSESGHADFFANACYSWAGPSSFRISGWKNMVETIMQTTRIPILLAEYGSSLGRTRPWDEVACLYSPDMTRVYSGGFAYTLLEGGNGYGVVEIDRDTGRRRQKNGDYANLRRRMVAVNERSVEAIVQRETMAYEERGFPERNDVRWEARDELPPFPASWEEVVRQVLAESVRVDGQASRDNTVRQVDQSAGPGAENFGTLSIYSTNDGS